jgi:hypothetical protein
MSKSIEVPFMVVSIKDDMQVTLEYEDYVQFLKIMRDDTKATSEELISFHKNFCGCAIDMLRNLLDSKDVETFIKDKSIDKLSRKGQE